MIPGRPPSYDRLEFRRRRLVLGAVWCTVCIAVTAATVWITVNRRSPSDAVVGTSVAPISGNGEAERAIAYAAMRRYVETLLDTPDVSSVYWRENRHESRSGYYLFIGVLDVERPGGTLDRFPYSAAVERAWNGGWQFKGARVGGREFVSSAPGNDEETSPTERTAPDARH